jgi:predicted PurR-regulated permease PerM
LVALATLAFLAGTVALAGMQIAQQAGNFQDVITRQANRGLEWASGFGFVPGNIRIEQILEQVMGSLGRLTYAVTSVIGAITSLFLIIVIGLFVAVEPRLYERGVGWMLPMRSREGFYRTIDRMAFTLRRLMAGRLLGMAVEGLGTWALLWVGGVPMAALLGLLTGILAFLPNIGAIISGVLIVLVGFSVSTETGLWAIGVYAIVQLVDGYLIVPYVARKTVDLAPALVLGAQLIFGAMFGILGLALADPIMAMAKAALQQKSEEDSGLAGGKPEP